MKTVLTFESIHKVLKAEKLLKKAGLAYEIIPTPREISSDCGMAVRVDEAIGELAEAMLLDKGLNTKRHKV